MARRLVGQGVGEGHADRAGLDPIKRSMWAISFPSPTRASPMFIVMLLAMASLSWRLFGSIAQAPTATTRWDRCTVTNHNSRTGRRKPTPPAALFNKGKTSCSVGTEVFQWCSIGTGLVPGTDGHPRSSLPGPISGVRR